MRQVSSWQHPIPFKRRWWASVTCMWSCFSCDKLATGQRKCPKSICRQNTVQKGQMNTRKAIAKLCQDWESESFIIPASQKVCQIVWDRRLKIDVPMSKRILGTFQNVSCLYTFYNFWKIHPCAFFILRQYLSLLRPLIWLRLDSHNPTIGLSCLVLGRCSESKKTF